MIPEAESDYGEDLAEIYREDGEETDAVYYQAIHLMDKGPNYNLDEEGGEKFQDPGTGAHFEYLDMCRRLKRLQTKRNPIDQLIQEERELRKREEERQ